MTVLEVSGFGFPYGGGGGWSTRSRQKHNGFSIASDRFSIRFDGEAEVQDTDKLHAYNFSGLSQSSKSSSAFIHLVSGQATLETARSNGSLQGEAKVDFKDVVVKTGLSNAEVVMLTVPASTTSFLGIDQNGVVSAGKLVLQLEKARVLVTVLAADQIRIDVDNNSDGSIDATQTQTFSTLMKAAML